uniref:Uncharacterized protein n=1 Tax=Pseudoalteromonas rubra TaxID=43658 RepID=A0A0F4QTZ6_9GAMM|nr:hypothetical protein TW77_07510 [Pseudoalteromonas rubra]
MQIKLYHLYELIMTPVSGVVNHDFLSVRCHTYLKLFDLQPDKRDQPGKLSALYPTQLGYNDGRYR